MCNQFFGCMLNICVSYHIAVPFLLFLHRYFDVTGVVNKSYFDSQTTTQTSNDNTFQSKTVSTFTTRQLSKCPLHSVAFSKQRRQRWRQESIDTAVMYDGTLNCRVTIRHGVLYYRYWDTPVGYIKRAHVYHSKLYNGGICYVFSDLHSTLLRDLSLLLVLFDFGCPSVCLSAETVQEPCCRQETARSRVNFDM